MEELARLKSSFELIEQAGQFAVKKEEGWDLNFSVKECLALISELEKSDDEKHLAQEIEKLKKEKTRLYRIKLRSNSYE